MTYLGYDVLELDYDRQGPIDLVHDRKFALLDAKTGKRIADEQAEAPAPHRPFIWTAFGRAETARMLQFLDDRKGRAVPFWFPSLQWDLSLAEDVSEEQSIISVDWIRYRQQFFGTTGARRHICFWRLGQGTSFDCYQVTDATDPGDEATESLTISPTAVSAYEKAVTVISFLHFCRLDPDLTEVSYPSGNIAQATIHARELPMEAPL